MEQTISITFYQSVSIIICVVLIIAFIAGGVYRAFQNKRSSGYFWHDRVEAEAIVLDIHETGFYTKKQPQVSMQMQVQPERGKNFVAEVKKVLAPNDREQYFAGAKIRVRFNPRNIKEVMIVKQDTDQKIPFTK